MKRFYETVSVRDDDGGWRAELDGRAIKTVRGAAQIVPTRALAEKLAQEWEAQGETIDPGSFPMRDMANYAIDMVAPARREHAAALIAFAETDTLLYRADPGDALRARQETEWEPIVAAFEARENVSFERVSGIMHRAQDSAALDTIEARLARLDPFALAGLEAMTHLAASLITGLSAMEADADPDALWRAASLEEEWQAQLWGRDAEAETRRKRRRGDFIQAFDFARAARR